MRLLKVLSFCIALSTGAIAQTKTFHPSKPVTLDFKLGSNDAPANDVMCDKSGNTFVTIYDPATNDRSDRPMLKFDKSGSLKAEFPTGRKILGLSEYEDPFEPSALLPGGGVARLVWSRDGMSLARFTAEGKLESRTKLEGVDRTRVVPYQLAAFPSGEVLVSGLEGCRSSRCIGGFKSFTAIYDQGGHLLKRLSIPEDDEIDAAAEIGDSRYASGPMFGNRAVSGGKIQLGDDGNVYLMRRTSPATVYVISSSGDVVRTVKIEPAQHGWASIDMQISGERMAIEFSDCSPSRCEGFSFSVANALSGDRLADYADSQPVPPLRF